MSRSYRRPYMAITGAHSAKEDKQRAARGVRRRQNRALQLCRDHEELLLPHFRECPWNNVWVWDRDGRQFYVSEQDWCWRPSLLRK